jgi:hypothetical protein
MKTRTFFICLLLLLAGVSRGQTQFWSDTFEDAGAPSSGTRTPENNGGMGSPSYTSYFVRTSNFGINVNTQYSLFEGAKFWAGENHTAAFGAGKGEQQIDLTGINIAGKTGLSFKGMFAANAADHPWDNRNYTTGTPNPLTDYVIVEYRIDGGAYKSLIKFFGNNNTDKYLSEDTGNDSLGDGPGLTPSFAEYTKAIAETGTTLDLRIKAFSNGTNEEWAIDNFRLSEVIPCNMVLTKGTVKNVTCKGGKDGTAGITATGANGAVTYNWAPGNPMGDGTANITALAAGTYTCTVTDAANCVKTIEVKVTEPDAITKNQNITICSGKSITVGTHTYNTTGNYTDVLKAKNGCDSTVYTNLTVTQAITKTQEFTICAGKSITVGTHTYNTTGTYTDPFKTKEGCDSIVTTKLTVLKAIATNQNLYICQGKSVKVGNSVYTKNGTYTDVLKAKNGCDSTVTTYLNVSPAPTYSQQFTVCKGGSIKIGDHIYTKDGMYKDTVKTKAGCDSIVTSYLTFSTIPYSGQQTLTRCEGKPVIVGTHIHTKTGTYKDTIKTVKGGCDSVVTTNLTVTPAPTSSQTLTTCAGKPIKVGDHFHGATGTYKDTVKTKGGCDSIVTTNLTVFPAVNGSQAPTTCAGKPFKVGNHLYYKPGTYKDTVKTPGGCDSIVTTYLTVTAAPTGSQTLTTCAGKPVKVGDHFHYVTGIYKDTVKTGGGCDSIVTTDLTVTPAIVGGSRSLTTCAGKPVKIGNIYYSVEGTYKDTVKTGGGCDSIVSVALTVTKAPTGSQTLTICEGKPLVINNHIYSTSGTYVDTVKSPGGCDSVLTTYLTVNPSPVATLDLSNIDTVCIGLNVTLTGGLPAGGVYSGVGVTGNVFNSGTAGLGVHQITYTITDLKGCEGFVKGKIYVDLCTSVDNEQVTNNLVVYPNPYSDKFRMELTLVKSDMVSIRMINILGETVKHIESSVLSGVYKNEIDTKELPNGIYFITVQTSDSRIVQRVIKN